MERDGGNVIDLGARRGAMVPRPLREVEAYWELLRNGRIVPDRSEMDPRGFAGALPWTFLLERIAPGIARLRLSGRHLSDLMGIEVQGLPFSTLFLPEARAELVEALSAVFEEPAVARLKLHSEGGIARQPLEAQLLILPLRDDLGDVTRAVGCLVAEGAVGRTPRRFVISDMRCQTLIGFGRPPGTSPGPAPPGGKVVPLPRRRPRN